MANYKNQNTNWENKKDPIPQKYKHKNHPWSHQNRFVKQHHEKIWTETITPENEAVQKTYSLKQTQKKGITPLI